MDKSEFKKPRKKTHKEKLAEFENGKDFYKLKKQNLMNSLNEVDNFEHVNYLEKKTTVDDIAVMRERMKNYHQATKSSKVDSVMVDIGVVGSIKDQKVRKLSCLIFFMSFNYIQFYSMLMEMGLYYHNFDC